ncbi:MAG: MerR family transcriptional regulator [Pseudomonadota bacterium]
MRIGELARRTATAVDTIRYYERVGLLPAPARTSSNYRSYSAAEVERLRFIRRCRDLDIPVADIHDLLRFCGSPGRHCRDVDALLERRIRQIESRIDELNVLARELRQLRAVCRNPGAATGCRTLQSLRQSGTRPYQRGLAHKARSAQT